MKITNKLLAGTLILMACTACTSEAFDGFGKKENGIAKLNIDIKKPQARAVSEVDYFPVTIYDARNAKVQSYETVSEIPEKVILNVGTYTVESHTPGVIQKQMNYPYYMGTESIEIMKGITSDVEVVCKMQNSKININYSDEFKAVFTSWQITITDGSETALSFDHNSSNETYWYFGEDGVNELAVNFRGMTTDGNIISKRTKLTKNLANQGYDDDEENFGGGDELNLNFTPTETTDGKINGINIKANVIFTETNKDVTVNVVDKPGFGVGEDPNVPDDPPTTDDITLSLPADMTVSSDTDPKLGDTKIRAAAGLKSIKVSITSTSDEMISSLNDLNDGYGVDFIKGAEIVENTDVVDLFNDLGQTLTVPNEGDKNYTFPIGNFFNLLTFLSGEHTFHLVITDMNGNTKSGTLKLTVQ